jgi:hypothetical protein
MAAAYVASARIDRARPHVLPPDWARAAMADLDMTPLPATANDMSRLDDRDLLVRWESFRERWSQLTFYLFDAESWR